MCDPLTIALVGTGMQMAAQQQAASRGRAAMGRMENRNDEYNRRINDLTAESTQQYNPQTRAEAQHMAETQANDSLNKTLQQGTTGYGPTTEGNVSKAYTIESAKRLADDTGRASKIAAFMSKLRSPNELRLNEGYSNADNASRMGRVATNQARMANAGQIDVASSAQPDAGLMLAGSLAQAYGLGSMGAKTPNIPPGQPVAVSQYGPVWQTSGGPVIPRSLFR